MTAIYGLYRTPQAAQRAFDSLRAGGIPAARISIMSSEPFEGWEFARQDSKTVMPWIAAGGGLMGLIGAYLLTALTQEAWPIKTGGMPIVSNWTNIIVIFELTMLGAVLATVFTLLITSRLPARLPKIYDPAVSDGRILVGVEGPEAADAAEIERLLSTAGPEAVRTS